MDISRRSFLSSIGLGAVSLTLPKNTSLVESLIRKVGPPPVNAGFARAIFPRGFRMMQLHWASMSTFGFDLQMFRPKGNTKTTLMHVASPSIPDRGMAVHMVATGGHLVSAVEEAEETFEFWIRSHNPEEVSPNIKMVVTGIKTSGKEDSGKWEVIDIPIRKVRLDHGWALKNGIIRPDEPPAITYEKEEEHDDAEDSELSDSE